MTPHQNQTEIVWRAGVGELIVDGKTICLPQHEGLVFSELWSSRGRFVFCRDLAALTALTTREVRKAILELQNWLPLVGAFIVESKCTYNEGYRFVLDSFRGSKLETIPLSSLAASSAPRSSPAFLPAQAEPGPSEFEKKGA